MSWKNTGGRARFVITIALGLGLFLSPLTVLDTEASSPSSAPASEVATAPGNPADIPLGDLVALDANSPRTDGVFVIWEQHGTIDDGVHGDIYAVRVDDLKPFVVAEGLADQRHPVIHGGKVVWTERLDNTISIQGRNLHGDDTFTIDTWDIGSPDFPDANVGIFGDWVVWVSAEESPQEAEHTSLWARNIVTMAEPILLRRVLGRIHPAINDDRIAWMDYDRITETVNLGFWHFTGPDDPVLLQQLGYDHEVIDSPLVKPAVNRDWLVWMEHQAPAQGGGKSLFATHFDEWEPFLIGDMAGFSFTLDGIMVVYDSSAHMVAYDLVERRSRNLTAITRLSSPLVKGRWIFYEAFEILPEINPRYESLYMAAYDLQTDSSFRITEFFPEGSPFWFQPEPDASGDTFSDTLVWVDLYETSGLRQKSIRAATIGDILPSARRPDLGITDPGWTYYPETGHYLQLVFKSYWESTGGLPVFGYPLTEEFTERSIDTGQNYTVQFTERQRFEWHPDNAGTPYEVLLSRLGSELLTLQGRDWTTFPKADPGVSLYFTETGHAIASEFWSCWSTHGLEFGDDGVSFRESLALFGYPLSPAMMETNADGHTVLTQYFERAVFEYHPDNHDPYEVLLRRLGAEMLVEREW